MNLFISNFFAPYLVRRVKFEWENRHNLYKTKEFFCYLKRILRLRFYLKKYKITKNLTPMAHASQPAQLFEFSFVYSTNLAIVAARICAELTPSAHSTISKPPSTTSSTPKFVIMRSTTPFPVRGSVQEGSTLLSPCLLV